LTRDKYTQQIYELVERDSVKTANEQLILKRYKSTTGQIYSEICGNHINIHS